MPVATTAAAANLAQAADTFGGVAASSPGPEQSVITSHPALGHAAAARKKIAASSPSTATFTAATTGRQTRITATVRISGPRAPVRRSSRTGNSIFSTKNLAAAVKMVAAKAVSPAVAEPRAVTLPTKAAAAAASSSSSSSSCSTTMRTLSPLPAGQAVAAPPSPSPSPAAAAPAASASAHGLLQHHRTHSAHRVTKATGTVGSRKVFARIGSMEPPVQSFYGAEPIPLPSRFATIKRRLIHGREDAIAASWRRLLVALRDEIAHIQARGTGLVPTIAFADIDDPARVAPFARDLRRYGVALVRGVVSQSQTEEWIRQTRAYLTRNRDHIKPTIPQDPTCFELFWTPAQCAIRAHPSVLRVQQWAMTTFWETKGSDADLSRVATRFPIAYADRLRIHDSSIMGSSSSSSNSTNTPPPVSFSGNSAADSLSASAAATLIAQVDNGSLERWEPDGYGAAGGGAYDAIFRGDWEAFDPWDPSARINVTQDLYNGAGACSIFRMFQGILALTSGEPASIRVLPSPKLAVAYLLLRPFFSPRTAAPSPTAGAGPDEDGASPEAVAEWDAFLDPANWTLDATQSTIIHGAVPGHAQRITELWHPHLRLRRSLVEIPTLQAGDYVLWHCDQAYSIMTTPTPTPTTTTTTPAAPSMLMYTPACPLTQTNALFLARQRKAFLQGQPGPDFDSAGSAMGSEAPHEGRPGRDEIAAVGGDAGLRAMGLAPWELSRDGNSVMTRPGTRAATPTPGDLQQQQGDRMDVDSGEAAAERGRGGRGSGTEGEAEVVRLANIILFPDRYDFYIPSERAEGASGPRINGRAQAEQMAATRQLISRILS